jgi:hypothetical protein
MRKWEIHKKIPDDKVTKVIESIFYLLSVYNGKLTKTNERVKPLSFFHHLTSKKYFCFVLFHHREAHAPISWCLKLCPSPHFDYLRHCIKIEFPVEHTCRTNLSFVTSWFRESWPVSSSWPMLSAIMHLKLQHFFTNYVRTLFIDIIYKYAMLEFHLVTINRVVVFNALKSLQTWQPIYCLYRSVEVIWFALQE